MKQLWVSDNYSVGSVVDDEQGTLFIVNQAEGLVMKMKIRLNGVDVNRSRV